MKVLNFVRPENGLTQDPLYYMGFEKYEDVGRDCYFFMADFFGELSSGKYDDKERVVLTLEEPNFCVPGGDAEKYHLYADKILTLCPFMSVRWLKREGVFFPFNEDWIPPETYKDIDICYFGSFPKAVRWDRYMGVASQYHYRYGYYMSGNMPNCSYKDKIDTLARSKITLVHGLCNDETGLAKQLGFIETDVMPGALPQIKSRMFEAAFSKSLMLCQYDPWHPIEYYFTEEEDFLYFLNEQDLRQKIDYILNHYDEFDSMRESAYNLAVENYTTKHFVEKYLT